MSNNHILTKNIGNLRGFSTDSSFVRPPNVADVAVNLMRNPDTTLGPRRGFQCQVADIGGLGLGNFDNTSTNSIETVTLDGDGNLYKLINNQIYLYYDGRNTGSITGATQANPVVITSVGHGLQTGAQVIIRNVGGMAQINNLSYFITVIDPNNFSLDGIDGTGFDAYTSGGDWIITFTENRYLNFTIFTDPRFLASNLGWSIAPWSYSPWGAPSGESITCQITAMRAAQIQGASGSISNATQANPCQITDANHNLQTGMQIAITGVVGMTQLNGNVYTVTVIDTNNFTLNVDSTAFGAYISGGTWTLQQGNIIPVSFGHELAIGDTVLLKNVQGIQTQRQVTAISATTITIDGSPIQVQEGAYVNQFFDIPFRKGFDVVSPYLLSTFIATITNPTTGVFGLEVAANGPTNFPAAFLQITEPTVINSNTVYTLQYFHWIPVNKTVTTTFPGSANVTYQNSQEFENASFASYDEVIYIANGFDFPQKYDGQTVYRAGILEGVRPTGVAANVGTGQLSDGNYNYAITYEQVDALGHSVEGVISEGFQLTLSGGPSDATITVNSIPASTGWNTDGALATGGTATVYGPDSEGYQYHLILVANSPHTMKIGDTAFYNDTIIATKNGTPETANTYTVLAGHGVEVGDRITFLNTDGDTIVRTITAQTETTITFDGPPVSVGAGVNFSANKANLVFGNIAIVDGNQNEVTTINVSAGHTIQIGDFVTFTDIFNRVQGRAVTGTAATSITIQGIAVSVSNDILITSETIRATQFSVRRQNTSTTGATLSASAPISNNLRINIWRTVQDGTLYYLLATLPNNSITGTTQTFLDTIQAGRNTGAITGATQANPCVITSASHGLKSGNQLTIKNVKGMTQLNGRNYTITVINDNSFSLNGVDSTAYTAYDSEGSWEIIFTDNNELGFPFPDPIRLPTPPPVAKYLLAFGNQLLYAGGKRNTNVNSDNVFFSEGNQPESVPAATNFFTVPSPDDEITGLGAAGTTLIVFKNKSTHSIVGDLLTSQFQVNPIAPGTNIGCAANATIQSVGSLIYFLHTNGVYAITENQFYPTDAFGNPVPLSVMIDDIFRTTNFLPETQLVFKRATAINYTKDNQYLLFIPCEDVQTTQRTANQNSLILCYDYQNKNWFEWRNMNAAGGMFVIKDNLYFQERRFSGIVGNTANLYKQHRFYRLIDYADHASALRCEWRSSYEDLGYPEVRKKFVRCILLINRISDLRQFNNPRLTFYSYLNRYPPNPNTIADITTVNNQMNAAWNFSPWGYGQWAGYQDTFARINLKQGTVAKSMAVGFKMVGINMSFKLAGYQLEAVPEFRKTFVR